MQVQVHAWVGIAAILLPGESLTARLALAALLILGEVAFAVLPRARARRPR